MSHPVRVRGLEHLAVEAQGNASGVAPRAGAWVGTGKLRDFAHRLARRTPCGCVGWNLCFEPLLGYVDSRTPCGCVGWNFLTAHHLQPRKESHPVRVRGLEPSAYALCTSRESSHPVRVRGLERAQDEWQTLLLQVAPRAGAWVGTAGCL